MNILYLNLYSEPGGGELSLLHLVRHLDQRMKPLFVFARPGTFSRRLQEIGIETINRDFKPVMLSRLLHPVSFLKNIRAGFALARLIRDRQIDLVHCTDLFSLLLLLPAFLQTRIPIVYNVIMFYNKPQSALFRWLSSMMVRRIVAPSQAIMDDLVTRVGIPKERIELLYNGVDSSAFAPPPPEEKVRIRKELGIPADKRVVGFAGRYEVWKGHKTFLQAIELLTNHKNQIPNLQSSSYNLQFLMAGGAPTEEVVKGVTRYREDLEPAFRALEQKGVLRRLGHRDDMPAFYAALDLFVCPSDAEAFGLVVLEAFAAGLPIVVTRTTGAVELIGSAKGVYLVEPKNPGALARTIGLALEKGGGEVDAEERRRILEKYTWEEYAKGWEHIYIDQGRNSKLRHFK